MPKFKNQQASHKNPYFWPLLKTLKQIFTSSLFVGYCSYQQLVEAYLAAFSRTCFL